MEVRIVGKYRNAHILSFSSIQADSQKPDLTKAHAFVSLVAPKMPFHAAVGGSSQHYLKLD